MGIQKISKINSGSVKKSDKDYCQTRRNPSTEYGLDENSIFRPPIVISSGARNLSVVFVFANLTTRSLTCVRDDTFFFVSPCPEHSRRVVSLYQDKENKKLNHGSLIKKFEDDGRVNFQEIIYF